MVFIGGWRPRRRGYGNYYGGYGPAGYGGSSCGRDLCLLESGCCLAEMVGCGPQLTLLGPSMTRRSWRSASAASAALAASPTARGARAWMLAFLQSAIRIYQNEISSHRRSHCPYTPSCSHYASEALGEHGLRRGLWLSARRLVRCRPGTRGGDDPVPAAL